MPKPVSRVKQIEAIQSQVVQCTRCPRLVAWREEVGRLKVARFIDWEYWARPVPAFGDPNARLLLTGLAPAAHGGNRTGRMFTGDRSGDWLYRALYKAGFANQPTSVSRGDGLELKDCYITASARCAPPANKPLPQELLNCRPYLLDELKLLKNVTVVVGLGRIGCETTVAAFREAGMLMPGVPRRVPFKHGMEMPLNEKVTLIGSFHPSQQNTFTGKLTEPMFDGVFARVNQLLNR